MVDNGPFTEAVGVTQIAQIISVAEHLIRDFRIAHRGAVNVLVDCVAVLD